MQLQSGEIPWLLEFLRSSCGQIFATWCAYGALACITMYALLVDYSHLAFPFVIAAPCLLFIGMASRSHRRFAQTALALLIIPLNMFFVALPNLSNQASQQAHLQQQTIQLENQYNNLQDQETVLQKQLSLLQKRLASIQNQDQSGRVRLDIVGIEGRLPLLKSEVGDTNALITNNTQILQYNYQNLPADAAIQVSQRAIEAADEQIQFNSHNDARQNIDYNNFLLPAAERVQFVVRAYEKSCVSGYSCLSPLAWQQPFVDGWRRISGEPLAASGTFLLVLLLALLSMFILLPLDLTPLAVVSYQIVYNGLLANLNDPAFPEKKRRKLPAETSIVKVEVRSSYVPLRQANQREEAAQEFLSFNLGTDTTILDAFIEQDNQQDEKALAEVRYNKVTGNVILKVKAMEPQPVRSTKPACKSKVVRQFPIQLYIIVASFAGSIDAVTSIDEIERLQEQRGPRWLGGIAAFCHLLAWWVYAAACYIALLYCSFQFFQGSANPVLPLNSFETVFLIAGFIAKVVELIIVKATIRTQKAVVSGIPSLAFYGIRAS